MFSQAHLRAYLIGIVKLAFVTPATIRTAIPHTVLLMVGVPSAQLAKSMAGNFDMMFIRII
jgi:hypothetical protein